MVDGMVYGIGFTWFYHIRSTLWCHQTWLVSYICQWTFKYKIINGAHRMRCVYIYTVYSIHIHIHIYIHIHIHIYTYIYIHTCRQHWYLIYYVLVIHICLYIHYILILLLFRMIVYYYYLWLFLLYILYYIYITYIYIYMIFPLYHHGFTTNKASFSAAQKTNRRLLLPGVFATGAPQRRSNGGRWIRIYPLVIIWLLYGYYMVIIWLMMVNNVFWLVVDLSPIQWNSNERGESLGSIETPISLWFMVQCGAPQL